MRYNPSQVSDVDVQLLHVYRILKQPAEYFDSMSITNVHEVLTFAAGVYNDSSDVYSYSANTSVTGKIPFLVFSGPEQARKELANLTAVDVEDGTIVLEGTFKEFPENLKVECYWCDSFNDVSLLIQQVKADIQTLRDNINLLVDKVNALSFDKFLSTFDSKDDHLVKFTDIAGMLSLGDSGFKISDEDSAIQLVNPSQTVLNQVPKSLPGELLLSIDGTTLMVEQFKSGYVTIEGEGTIILYNVSSPIRFRNFKGSVIALQCNDIVLGDRTQFDYLHAVYSNVSQVIGYVNVLNLLRSSVFTHAGGNLHEVAHIGVNCTYSTTIPTYLAPVCEPITTPRNHIQGMFCGYDGTVIQHGHEVSFVTGEHDDPLQIDTIIYQKDTNSTPSSGSGTEPYPEVTGGITIPVEYQNLSTADYKSVVFTQSFMLTGAGPQTVGDITSETFHALRACMNWCCGEFGPSIYGQSYSKLIRTWCMYQQDAAYRGNNKTLQDFVNRLRTQVISWGGSDIWAKSYATLKEETLMTDEYALTFMQQLYNNIRYPQLFGLANDSDPDVYKAMSGMPVTNETINYATGDIPNYNKPVVWVVSKRAVLNEFSGYTGYYVLYRPESFNNAIRQGVNPAVLTQHRAAVQL